ncbi:J domain-containing protein [Halorubrum sp. FL23]|uniref:J domain-containing protein n=1 Tax=Halorubrum sp. FL23 TaxID=3458704 RepID=UPI0040331DEB
MVVELIGLLPPWVALGLALGAVASALVALAFYLGDRYVGPAPSDGAGGAGPGGVGRGPGDAAGTESGRAADERRRREIREYLRAIGERFDENHAFDGVAVPFYLPERGVAITFDAHDYFRLEGEGIYTVLCEHEMPGRGLGRRLPFDVTEPEWATGGGVGRGGQRVGAAGRAADRIGRASSAGGQDPVAAAFAELDVATDADAAEVKRAYRERVKETHPDQGGDEESFRRVREAYATARNHADGGVPESASR